MTIFTPIDKNLIRIGDVSTNAFRDISEAITSLDVSLTLDMSSQITLQVLDKDFKFAAANYFQIRRDIFYQDLIFEISRVDVSRSTSVEPSYQIVARSKNIQLMKRDKDPESFRGVTATQFAQTIATRFQMGFFGQNTVKTQTIVKARNAKNDESTWDVLSRAASDNKYIVFETNNILFFTSEQNLLGKWGDPKYNLNGQKIVPFGWPEVDKRRFSGADRKYVLLEMPTFGRSDDDVNGADGTIVVDRVNGRLLRPGMSIYISGIPDFEGVYLITSVDFSEGVSDPVRISFRTPTGTESGSSGVAGGVSGVAGGTGGSGFDSNATVIQGGPSGLGIEGEAGLYGGSSSGSSTTTTTPAVAPIFTAIFPQEIQNLIKVHIKQRIPFNENEPYGEGTKKYEEAVREAFKHANLIWAQGTLDAKNRVWERIRVEEAPKNIIAVNAVGAFRTRLSENATAASRRQQFPQRAVTLIQQYYDAGYFQSGYAQTEASKRRDVEAIVRDATEIYLKTTIADAEQLISSYKTKYGVNSVRYLIFKPTTTADLRSPEGNLRRNIRRVLFSEMPATLENNFP